jgi:hypothetical protein
MPKKMEIPKLDEEEAMERVSLAAACSERLINRTEKLIVLIIARKREKAEED